MHNRPDRAPAVPAGRGGARPTGAAINWPHPCGTQARAGGCRRVRQVTCQLLIAAGVQYRGEDLLSGCANGTPEVGCGLPEPANFR